MYELILGAPKCDCGEFKEPHLIYYATIEKLPGYLISWQCHGSETDPHFDATWQMKGKY